MFNALESELANQNDFTIQSNVNEEEQLAIQQTVPKYEVRKQRKTATQTKRYLKRKPRKQQQKTKSGEKRQY